MLHKVGPLQAEVREVPAPVATAVLLPGLGLGPWMFEPWFDALAAQKLRVVAPWLPGHGDDQRNVSLDEVLAGVRGLLDATPGPVTLIGHSFAGLVAQVIAAERPLHGVVALCPMLPRGVRALPEKPQLRAGLRLLPAIAAGRPVKVSWEDYRAGGLSGMEEGAAREAYTKITPWPNQICRDLLKRPAVDPLKVASPVLITLGKKDPLVPWDKARLLGDLYEAVVWRYDDLAHMPPLEPTGLRMGRDVARWAAAPMRPQVIESEAFMPSEGVGHDVRRQRRGEARKQRSAYGQKKAAR